MQKGLSPDVVEQIRQLGGEKLLEELVALYLEHTPVRMANLAEGRLDGDLTRIEKTAHSIRSSSVSLGAVAIAEAAATVERLAQDGTSGSDELGQRIDALERSVDELLRHLRVEFPGAWT